MTLEQEPRSRLPEGGVNLFQSIKAASKEAEERGVKLIRISIGQPEGPALQSAREAAARAVLSDSESMHEYQDNDSPGVPGFPKRFVSAHQNEELRENLDYLPIPGIKPMLGLVPLACGSSETTEPLNISTTTKPGYPTPKDWARGYLKQNVYELPLYPENEFRFLPSDIPPHTDLVMINYPHNPTGQIATKEWLELLCDHCDRNNIRLFNDAAYIALSHSDESTPLAEVAQDFPNLSWMEAYSASKVIGNGTGWRVGAIVGSKDFVEDLKTIKGNTDSGFAAPMAAGALQAVENDKIGIEKNRMKNERRLKLLGEILTQNGMQSAVEPKAGFFYLWKTPKYAFGQEISSAQQFNFAMIENTGVVGVHFEPYIRYAVCAADVEKEASRIDAAFNQAAVQY